MQPVSRWHGWMLPWENTASLMFALLVFLSHNQALSGLFGYCWICRKDHRVVKPDGNWTQLNNKAVIYILIPMFYQNQKKKTFKVWSTLAVIALRGANEWWSAASATKIKENVPKYPAGWSFLFHPKEPTTYFWWQQKADFSESCLSPCFSAASAHFNECGFIWCIHFFPPKVCTLLP